MLEKDCKKIKTVLNLPTFPPKKGKNNKVLPRSQGKKRFNFQNVHMAWTDGQGQFSRSPLTLFFSLQRFQA